MFGSWPTRTVQELQDAKVLLVEDGNHGEYRPRSDEFAPTGTAFIRAADLDAGVVQFATASRITNVALARIRKGIGRAGDILLSHKGTVGKLAVAPIPCEPFVCSPQTTFWRVLDDRTLDRGFLFAVMRSRAFREQLDAVKGETDMADYVSLTAQRRLKVPLPTVAVQVHISSILSALDDKIELNRRMNETLEAMARAIFQDWFVAFGPTRAKTEGRPPYLAPDLWALFPDRLDGEGKPEGWDTGPLSSLMEIISGGTPPTADSSSWNGQIPWYSVVDAPSDTDLFVFDTQRKLTSHGLQRSPGSLIAANTVIVSARGTVGKLAIAGVEMTFNQSCYALRPLRGFGDRGLFFALKTAVSRFHDLAHGAVFDTITKATFDAIQSVLPPASVARAFEDIADPLMLRIKANVAEGRSLAATRDLLLPRLMSGELRVKDAECAVEEAA
jgi:type I restriction enzyme S subunit